MLLATELIDAFVSDSGRVARFIESETPITWKAIDFPDYHAEFPGGAAGVLVRRRCTRICRSKR